MAGGWGVDRRNCGFSGALADGGMMPGAARLRCCIACRISSLAVTRSALVVAAAGALPGLLDAFQQTRWRRNKRFRGHLWSCRRRRLLLLSRSRVYPRDLAGNRHDYRQIDSPVGIAYSRPGVGSRWSVSIPFHSIPFQSSPCPFHSGLVLIALILVAQRPGFLGAETGPCGARLMSMFRSRLPICVSNPMAMRSAQARP